MVDGDAGSSQQRFIALRGKTDLDECNAMITQPLSGFPDRIAIGDAIHFYHQNLVLFLKLHRMEHGQL
jgi:hypothetical protein